MIILSEILQFKPERFAQVGVIAGIIVIIFGLAVFLAGSAIVSKIAERKLKEKLNLSQSRNILLWTKIFGFAIILTGVLVAVLVVK